MPFHDKESDLSEAKYPPSSHFSAKKFYDIAIYLNDLMFTARINRSISLSWSEMLRSLRSGAGAIYGCLFWRKQENSSAFAQT